MKKKSLSLLLAATLVASMLTGCGSTEKTTSYTGSQETSKETEAEVSDAVETEAAQEEEFTYPMEEGETLQYWCELTSTVSAYFSNLGDTPFGQGLQEATGVDIEFLHPASGQTDEQFSLIMTDDELPDLMEYNWISKYPGGPEKAIADGVIIPLNDVFEQYCPNLMKYLEEHPEVDRMIKTDEGHYYVFPFIRGDDNLLNTVGLMLRKDWLDELNLEVPTTIDEWYEVLTAFKNEKGATSPLCYQYTNSTYKDADPFAAAYETNRSFYLGSDGTVHYGAVEEGFKEYLTTMNKWYSEGLIDADLATLKNDQVSAKITSGEAGASMGQAGSRMGTWTTAARVTNPDYELVAAPVPTLVEGETAEFGYHEVYYSGKSSVAITTSCEDVERAARLLDWAYSEEGHMYYNFGTEGESYTMVED